MKATDTKERHEVTDSHCVAFLERFRPTVEEVYATPPRLFMQWRWLGERKYVYGVTWRAALIEAVKWARINCPTFTDIR